MSGCEVAVVGGGLLGSAFAYGLAARGAQVVLLDEGDRAIRAARGNFGLVWVQTKGLGMRPYARWTLAAARRWPELAARLLEETGIDVAYRRPGGFHLALAEAELAAHLERLARLEREAGEEGYAYEVLAPAELARRLPGVGPQVAGATYCPHDGHCDPLRLLRALHAALLARGARYRPGARVEAIEALPAGGFRVRGSGRSWEAERVVIAAGHGAPALAEPLGLRVPVRPDQGQVIVTERCRPRLAYPTNYVRQTEEGSFLLSPSSRDVGLDVATDTATLAAIAGNALRAFPFLATLRVQRVWAALRVMTPDGFPCYQHSTSAPGAFAFACHSGVTLASLHALEVPEWILAGQIPAPYRCFSPSRFDVPAPHPAH